MAVHADLIHGIFPVRAAEVETLTKPQDLRLAALQAAGMRRTNNPNLKVNFLDGTALEPEYVADPGAKKALGKPSSSSETIETEKIALVLPMTEEEIEDAEMDVENWLTESVFPGFSIRFSAGLLGRYKGSANDTKFARSMRAVVPHVAADVVDGSFNAATADSITLGTERDRVRRAIDGAMEILEARGRFPDYAVLSTSFAAMIRRERSEGDETVLAYNSLEDVGFGLPIGFDLNLDRSGSGNVAGYVGAWKRSAKLRLYKGISVGRSSGATLDDGTVVFDGQNNLRIIVVEARFLAGVADPLDFVPILYA